MGKSTLWTLYQEWRILSWSFVRSDFYLSSDLLKVKLSNSHTYLFLSLIPLDSRFFFFFWGENLQACLITFRPEFLFLTVLVIHSVGLLVNSRSYGEVIADFLGFFFLFMFLPALNKTTHIMEKLTTALFHQLHLCPLTI